MRTVVRASLRTYTRRYVAALVAVAVAVGFVVVTDALGSAAKAGLSSGVAESYRGGDLVVDGSALENREADRALAVADRHRDRAHVVGQGLGTVAVDGRAIGDDVALSTVRPGTDVSTGRQPRAPDEAVVDAGDARAERIRLGDELTLGTGDDAMQVRVVGLTDGTTYQPASVSVPWSTLSALPTTYADAIVYDAPADQLDARAAELEKATGAEVLSRDAFVDQRVQLVNQGIDVISYLLLLFAAIAGFVAVIVIANTFTILFAQRSRDLALLRCVGATRRQLQRSVRLESLAIALIASTIGIVGGALLGHLLTAVVRAFAGADRIGAVSLSASWLVPAFAGGVLTTLVAAWWPTRRVVRVSPLAALRPDDAPTVVRGAGVVRTGIAVVLLAGGAVALVGAVAGSQLPLLLLGGIVSFAGVLLMGPVLVPTLLRVAGRLLGRTGPSMRIAAANTVRNPRRSAATTASLLVGVTLTTAVLTGMASARAAVDDLMDGDHPVDASLSSATTLDDSVLTQVRRVDGVVSAVAVPGLTARAAGLGSVSVIAPDASDLRLVRDRAVVAPARGTILLPPAVTNRLDSVPTSVRLQVGDRSVTAKVETTGSEWGPAAIAAPDVVRELGGEMSARAVWLRAGDDVDADALDSALGSIVRDSDVTVTNGVEDRAYVDLQLDVLVGAVIGLLGVSVLIALVGIANTIGLSVVERGREHALLRALGLTRRQLRRVLAAEGLLLALVAAVLGTVIGSLYGWLGVEAIVRDVAPEAGLTMPWAQLAIVVLGAAIAGLLACVVPARRASRVAPAAGLTLD